MNHNVFACLCLFILVAFVLFLPDFVTFLSRRKWKKRISLLPCDESAQFDFLSSRRSGDMIIELFVHRSSGSVYFRTREFVKESLFPLERVSPLIPFPDSLPESAFDSEQ